MGLEFLGRVRRTTGWLAALLGLVLATYRHPVAGLAVALGAAWSLVNLWFLERLIVTLTGPTRATTTATRSAAFTLGGMMAWLGLGAVLLAKLPPGMLALGFLVPFVVLTLKAATLLLLDSRLWRSVTRSPWQAALLAAVLIVASWWGVDAGLGAARPSVPPAQNAEALALRQTEPATEAPSAVAEHGAEAAHEEEAESGPQKFPNVITFVTALAPHAKWAHFLHHYEAILYSLLVGLLLCVLAYFATRNPQLRPGKLQNGAELVVEKLSDFIISILGPKHGPRYVPFLGTLFLYILCMNLFGLVLFMDSPTSNLNITFALGLTVFVYVQYVGIRNLGVVGYADHMLGSPRDLTGWLLAPLMLPIHLLGELAKPISLSCRLFGNIFGEDMLMVAFATLGIGILGAFHIPFGLPMHAIFYPLALLTSGLQALVFTVLSTIYILLMLPHDEHGHEGEGQHAH